MNLRAKITREGEHGLDTTVLSLWMPDGDEENPVSKVTVAVTEDGLSMVDANGETIVVDDLDSAEKVLVEGRAVWPPEAVVYH